MRQSNLTKSCVLLIAAAVIAGCSSGSDTKSANLEALRKNVDPSAGSYHQPASKLIDLLPNAKSVDGETLSDSVVVGEFSRIAPGDGFIESGGAPTPGRPSASRTSFTHPDASWRTLRVTVSVATVLAGPRMSTVDIDWPLLGSTKQGEDADVVGRELRSLGRVLVISQSVPSGAEYAGLKRQIPDRQYGLAVVSSDGVLSFPLIAGDSGTAAEAFMDGVDTVTELRVAASGPVRRRD